MFRKQQQLVFKGSSLQHDSFATNACRETELRFSHSSTSVTLASGDERPLLQLKDLPCSALHEAFRCAEDWQRSFS
jgi:hypothetical protein